MEVKYEDKDDEEWDSIVYEHDGMTLEKDMLSEGL